MGRTEQSFFLGQSSKSTVADNAILVKSELGGYKPKEPKKIKGRLIKGSLINSISL